MKLLLILIFFIFGIHIISAVGIINCDIPNTNPACQPSQAITSPIVPNGTSSNNTFFWQGYTPQTYITSVLNSNYVRNNTDGGYNIIANNLTSNNYTYSKAYILKGGELTSFQDYKLGLRSVSGFSSMYIQGQTPNNSSTLALFSKDGDGTDLVALQIFNRGSPQDTSTFSDLLIGFNPNENTIQSRSSPTTLPHNLAIGLDFSTPFLYFNKTGAGVGINQKQINTGALLDSAGQIRTETNFYSAGDLAFSSHNFFGTGSVFGRDTATPIGFFQFTGNNNAEPTDLMVITAQDITDFDYMLRVKTGALISDSDLFTVDTAGNLFTPDNANHYFGNSLDSGIKYDGTNMIIKSNLIGTGKIQTQSELSTFNITPSTNNLYSIGSPTLRYKNIYSNGEDINGSINISGDISIKGNISATIPYAVFTDNTTQNAISTTAGQPMNFTITEDSYNINITGKQNITVKQAGDYHFIVSALGICSTNNKHINIWWQKNGVNVARSNTLQELNTANVEALMTIPFIIDLNLTDSLRIMWASDSTGCSLEYVTNTSFIPETPSVILTINRIGDDA